MSQIAPLRGRLRQYSGHLGHPVKFQLKMFIFLAFAPGFSMPLWPPLKQTPSLQKVGVKRGLVVQSHYFPFPCREWSRHIVCEGGSVTYNNRAFLLEMNGNYSNQAIHLDLIIISSTLSLRVTCTGVEGHWGELGQLTHRPHGPTNPEWPSLFRKHMTDWLWFGIQQPRI